MKLIRIEFSHRRLPCSSPAARTVELVDKDIALTKEFPETTSVATIRTPRKSHGSGRSWKRSLLSIVIELMCQIFHKPI